MYIFSQKNNKVCKLKIHMLFHMFVAEPVTEIAGGPDLFINKDSTINLTCYVRHAPEPLTIVWSHNHQVGHIFITCANDISAISLQRSFAASRYEGDRNPSPYFVTLLVRERDRSSIDANRNIFHVPRGTLKKSPQLCTRVHFHRSGVYIIDYRWWRVLSLLLELRSVRYL